MRGIYAATIPPSTADFGETSTVGFANASSGSDTKTTYSIPFVLQLSRKRVLSGAGAPIS